MEYCTESGGWNCNLFGTCTVSSQTTGPQTLDPCMLRQFSPFFSPCSKCHFLGYRNSGVRFLSKGILPKSTQLVPRSVILRNFKYRFKSVEIFDYYDLLRYRQLRKIWLFAIGYCAEWSHKVKILIIFVLCAIVPDLVMLYGHCTESGYALWTQSALFVTALWAMAQDLVMYCEPECPTNYHCAEIHSSILKVCHIL